MVVDMHVLGAEQGIAMPVRKRKSGRWCYREVVRLPNGTRKRIFGSAPLTNNTKVGAQRALFDAITALRDPKSAPPATSITFADWFDGRFWEEWVVGKKNKPTERRSKRSIFETHLRPAFGHLELADIDVGAIARFRASLVRKGLSDKRINNILSVLSKALNYAEDCELIESAPSVGLLRTERPEIEAYELADLARLIAAAAAHSPMALVAVLLACDAGARVGEIKALRWKEDVDLVARTITINQQVCDGETTTPKGYTRRTVPMTDRLHVALKALEVVRTGLVVRDVAGEPLTDSTADKLMRRHLCPAAELAPNGWHVLRHSFGTHAALFGVNPWRLQAWMGHKRIDETMRYVHVAASHARELPADVVAAGAGELDPDRRIIAMLGVRGTGVALSAIDGDGNRDNALS
jgi:integrase